MTAKTPDLPPALCPDLGIDARADAIYDVGYWRSLCPQLHVADADFTRRATAAGPFDFRNDPETVRGVRASMARDGYGECARRCANGTAVAAAAAACWHRGLE